MPSFDGWDDKRKKSPLCMDISNIFTFPRYFTFKSKRGKITSLFYIYSLNYMGLASSFRHLKEQEKLFGVLLLFHLWTNQIEAYISEGVLVCIFPSTYKISLFGIKFSFPYFSLRVWLSSYFCWQYCSFELLYSLKGIIFCTNTATDSTWC